RPQLTLLTDADRIIHKRNTLIASLSRHQLTQIRVLRGLFLWGNCATKVGTGFGHDDRIVWSRRDIGGMRAHEAEMKEPWPAVTLADEANREFGLVDCLAHARRIARRRVTRPKRLGSWIRPLRSEDSRGVIRKFVSMLGEPEDELVHRAFCNETVAMKSRQ